jgi:hypothetical protein
MSTEQANTSPETGVTADQAAASIEALLTDDTVDNQNDETQQDAEHEHDDEHLDEHEHDEQQIDEHEESNEHDEQASHETLEIDGKTITLDEVKKGYLRQADYTRKTTELATQRQTLATEVTNTQQERAKYAQALEQAHALIAQLEPAEPDWNALYQADPAQYAATREMWRTYQEQKQAVEAERSRVAQSTRAEQTKAQGDYVKAQAAKLVEALPAWADEKIAKQEKTAIFEWGTKQGFSPEELSTIADHRAVVIMRKAMLFDRAQATKAALKPGQAPTTSKVRPATPGAQATRPSNVSEATRAKQRLAKTGKVSDAAAALALLLD